MAEILAKTVPNWATQQTGHIPRSTGRLKTRTRKLSPNWFDSPDDEPLYDMEKDKEKEKEKDP